MNEDFEKWFSENNTRLPTWYSNPYDEEALKIAFLAGVAAERERLQPYIDQLEQAWLQLTRGNLIDGGMKVEQARIHAQARLDEAKHKILSSAIRGQG